MNRKNVISKWAMSVHGWLGMVTGIFLLMMGLSGSMIVFLKETDHFLNAELLHVNHRRKDCLWTRCTGKLQKIIQI